MNIYVLAGGLGTRVRGITEGYQCDKHEIPICGRPFYKYVQEWLAGNPIVENTIYITTPGVGTGGAIKLIEETHTPFLLLYGDTYTPVNITELYESMLVHSADMMVVTREVAEPDYGLLRHTPPTDDPIDGAPCNMLLYYSRYHEEEEYTTNVGMYLVGRRSYEYIRNHPWNSEGGLSLEHDLMGKLLSLLTVCSYDCTDLPLYDVGTPTRVERTEELMRERINARN